MNRSILTIAIPTYNRHVEVLETLKQIIPQLNENEGVCIVIVDNCSDINVEEHIRINLDNGILERIDIRFIRNAYNVGADGNYIKCFESCTTKYIWLLADDDLLEKNAIKSILAELRRYDKEDIVGINFTTDLCITPRTVDYVIDSIPAFIDKLDYFSNVLFISASVYNTQKYICNIRYSYWGAYSMASQIISPLINISKGGKFIFSKELIIKNKPSDINVKWSEIRLCLSNISVIEAPIGLKKSEYLCLGKKLYANAISMLVVYVCILKSINCDISKIDSYHIYLFKQLYSKTCSFRSNRLRFILEYLILLFLLRVRFLNSLVVKVPFIKEKITQYNSFDLFVRK